MPARKQKKTAKTTPSTPPRAPREVVPDELVHYYRLIFQVAPGGSRKSEFFVAGTLDEIKEAARRDLESPEGAYHALFYGETIVLQCWEGTRKLASIDLHPFITYHLSDRDEPVRFPGPGDDPVFDMDEELEELMNALLDGQVTCTVDIAWHEVPLPSLAGRPLRPPELAPFDGDVPWSYGLRAEWDSPIPDP
ncbi:MAG TPA: hypothetical protein VIK91_17695 [Nannocystis sp.]